MAWKWAFSSYCVFRLLALLWLVYIKSKMRYTRMILMHYLSTRRTPNHPSIDCISISLNNNSLILLSIAFHMYVLATAIFSKCNRKCFCRQASLNFSTLFFCCCGFRGFWFSCPQSCISFSIVHSMCANGNE